MSGDGGGFGNCIKTDYSRGDQPPPMPGQMPPGRQNPLANYQFSSDELRVLRECNSESFFQRSLPLGTSFGLAAYFGVRNGRLKANVKYGAVPKVVVGVIIGYFLGKVSYQRKCAEKIMHLPNSKLAEILRQKKNVSTGGMVDSSLTPGFGLAPFASATKDDVYDDASLHAEKSNSLDLDFGSNRPSGLELDDTQHPALDTLPELPIEPTKKSVTYEELRKTNRERHQKSSESIFNRPIGSEGINVIRSSGRRAPQENIDENENVSSIPSGRNKYGDSWS